MNYGEFLSRTALARKPSAIRALQPLIGIPGMLNLGGGMPNPELFPFETMQVKLKDGNSLQMSGQILSTALQYSGSRGLPKLLDQLAGLQRREHGRPDVMPGKSLIVGTGSQDLLDKTFGMLLNPGDPILVENPTYSGALASLTAARAQVIFVDMDEHGLRDDALRAAVHGAQEAGRPRPRVLYTIPTGQNPSGASAPEARRRAVYQAAKQLDLLIIEDDPYRFLHFGSDPQPPSYFSMDTDGRVLRFDSLSKVVSSGIRFGWATGPEFLIGHLELSMQASSLHASGLTQTLVSELMAQWGDDGWTRHLSSVQSFYRRRRDLMVAAMDRHLAGLVRYTSPSAGMFLFCELVNPPSDNDPPLFSPDNIRKHQVIAVSGDSFSPSKRHCFRVAFSVIPEDQIEEAVKRLANLIKHSTTT